MEVKRSRGRPPTFLRSDREYLADLIRMYGLTGARRAAKFSICHKTLMNIAREFGIELKKGRRRRGTPSADCVAPHCRVDKKKV